MSLHDDIKAHAKLVAKDVKAGKASAHSAGARDFMDDLPDAVLGVIELVHGEANRKKPNEATIQAYVYMFAAGLEGIRYGVEQGQEWAEEQPAPTLSDIAELFESMVEQAGGNEFEVHNALADISKALPPEFRIATLYQITTSDNPGKGRSNVRHGQRGWSRKSLSRTWMVPEPRVSSP